METNETPWLERIERIGGEPCLDFVNSVSDRIGPEPIEQLRNYPDLLAWLRRCELLPAVEAEALQAISCRRPEPALKAFRGALRFRDAAWRLLWAAARGKVPVARDLGEIEAYRNRLRGLTGIQPSSARGFGLTWQGGENDPERAMWRTASALEKFLLSDELARLRGCAGETCGWLFVDRSRNGMRRWCSMRDCGNRAKARRHYQRVSRA